MAIRVVASSVVVGVASGVVPPSDLPSQYLTDDARFYITYEKTWHQLGDKDVVCPIDACERALQSAKQIVTRGGHEFYPAEYPCGQCLTSGEFSFPGMVYFCSEDGTSTYSQTYDDRNCTKPTPSAGIGEHVLALEKDECSGDYCEPLSGAKPGTWERWAWTDQWGEIVERHEVLV